MSPSPLRMLDAPCPYREEFRSSPSGRPRVSQPSSLRLFHPTRYRSLRSSMFGPSLPAQKLSMPSADFCPPFMPPRSGTSTRQAGRSPRVLRMRFRPMCPSHLRQSLPDDYRTFGMLAPSSRDCCLTCASCSSGRDFAYTFLQTPPRGGSPWCSASGSRHQGPQRTFTS